MTWWSKEPGVSSDIVFRTFWNLPTTALEELWSYLCCVTNQPTLLSLTAWHLKQMSVTWISDSKDHSRLCFNFLCEKLFWRNMNIHWHFISFFATLRVQVVEVCLQERQEPGPRFNIKMSSYQYRKSHCGDKTVIRSSYLHNGISYAGKTTSLYWIGSLLLPHSQHHGCWWPGNIMSGVSACTLST